MIRRLSGKPRLLGHDRGLHAGLGDQQRTRVEQQRERHREPHHDEEHDAEGLLHAPMVAGATGAPSGLAPVRSRAMWRRLRRRTFAPSREGIPEDFLFRAGGSRSNRGYAFQSLGVQQGEAVVGGRYLLTGSAEFVHWLNDKWGGAVFVDVGDATDSSKEWKGKPSYGPGVRFKTPAGPLALDLAYAQDPRKFRLSFSVSIAF